MNLDEGMNFTQKRKSDFGDFYFQNSRVKSKNTHHGKRDVLPCLVMSEMKMKNGKRTCVMSFLGGNARCIR